MVIWGKLIDRLAVVVDVLNCNRLVEFDHVPSSFREDTFIVKLQN